MAKTRNKYYNPNPAKKETGDCVVRALCRVEGRGWDEVYRELCEIGYEKKEMPSSDNCWKEYLMRRGYKYKGISVTKGSKRPKVGEFATKHREGYYILRVANHIVASVEGYYYDTWDCGENSLYGYWEKP